MMSERTKPHFTFGPRVVMSAETFKALPIVKAEPTAASNLRISKAMLARDGRVCWHTVERQSHFGLTLYMAHEIVVRLYSPEAA